MVVINHFDEWFHFAALLHSLFAHATCDFDRISFDASDESVGERMLLCPCVDWLYDHDLSRSGVRIWVAMLDTHFIEKYRFF